MTVNALDFASPPRSSIHPG